MKKMNLIPIILLTFCLSACSKNRICYTCQYGSAGTVHTEKVCTNDGHPEEKLPDHDQYGAVVWACKER